MTTNNTNHKSQEAYDESDSSDSQRMQQALPVEPTIKIDLSRPPASAEEYLARVRYEARKLPKVLTAASTPQKPKNTNPKPMTASAVYRKRSLLANR